MSVQCVRVYGNYKVYSTSHFSNDHPETQNQLNQDPPTSPPSVI